MTTRRWQVGRLRADKLLRVMLVLAVLVPVAACRDADGGGSGDSGARIPGGKQVGVIRWLSDGWIYLLATGGSDLPAEVWRTRPGGTPARVNSPVPEGNCSNPRLSAPFFVSGDELGGLVNCGNEYVLVSWRPGGGRVSTLARLPHEPIWSGAAANGGRVFVARLKDSCSRVVRLDAEVGSRDRGIVVSTSVGPISIDGGFAEGGACVPDEDVAEPTLSSDGSRLYFTVTQAAGRFSTGRQTSERNLYVADAGGGPAKRIANGFWNVRDIAVSPDGRHLAVAMQHLGASFVNVESGSARRISSQSCDSVSFSPKGDEAALLVDDESDGGSFRQEIKIVQVKGGK